MRTGGHAIGDKGNFCEPTVVTDVPNDAKAMNEEPFGPLAMINPFRSFDDAVEEANRLPFGLAAYAWTKSAKTANAIAAAVETGMISINHVGLALPETPFGGVKDSGYGSEGGSEGDRGLPEPEVHHAGRRVRSKHTNKPPPVGGLFRLLGMPCGRMFQPRGYCASAGFTKATPIRFSRIQIIRQSWVEESRAITRRNWAGTNDGLSTSIAAPSGEIFRTIQRMTDPPAET